jgi:ABC-type tungstate transport system substrate-binding protein
MVFARQWEGRGITRILTTAITLEVGKGVFARAISLGIVLLTLAFLVHVGLVQGGRGHSNQR